MLTQALKLVNDIEFNSFNYITLDELIDELDSKQFSDIIKNKILIYDKSEDIANNYLMYFMSNNKFKPNNVYINLTNQCNCKCIYCFGDDYMPNNVDLNFNDLETSLEYLFSNYISTKKITINFFGGEPLLKFPLIKQLINMVNEKYSLYEISYSITTNGICLNDEIIEYLTMHFSKVTISVDGNENHMLCNRNVVYEKSQVLYSNIERLSQHFDNLAIRVTITKFNTNIVEIYKFFRNLGVKKIRFQPVSCLSNDSFAIEDWNKLSKEIELLRNEYINNFDSIMIRPFYSYIDQFFSKQLKFFSCSLNILSVNESNNIYPCFRVCGQETFEYKQSTDVHDKLLLAFVDNKSKCLGCWCKYICGGGCYADSFYYEGDIYSTYDYHCIYKQKMIEESIKIYKNLIEDEKNGFNKVYKE